MKRSFTLLAAMVILLTQPRASLCAETEPITAFKSVNLVPMTAETVLPEQTVLVQGKQIVAVGPTGRVGIPVGARIIDGSGAYLMPGLADMHIHIRSHWLDGSWPVSPLQLFLANGVTTIRCFGPGGKTGAYALRWRDEIDSGARIGPRIYTCGRILRGPVEHAERAVIKQKYTGFDFIKIYSYVTPAEYQEIMTTARKLGIYTAGHIPFQVGLPSVIAADMDEIAHVEELFWELVDFDRDKDLVGRAWLPYVIEEAFEQYRPYLKLDKTAITRRMQPSITRVADQLSDSDIPVCTTLYLDEVIVEKLFQPQMFLKKPVNRYLPQWYIEQFRQGKEKHQRQFKGGEEFAPWKYTVDRLFLTSLKQRGVPLLLGTDAGTGGLGVVAGFSIHDELRVLVENGFSPFEAIATGTRNISPVIRKMTGQWNLGTVAVGNRADLLLVEQNPLEDVAHIRMLKGVMAGGRWFDKSDLEKMTTLDPPAATHR